MGFNPGSYKQAQKVIFSYKYNKPVHPPLFFNNHPLVPIPKHKHLGMVLDNRLDFKYHIQLILPTVSQPIASIRKLRLF